MRTDTVLCARAVQCQVGSVDNCRPAGYGEAAAFYVGMERTVYIGRTFEREIEGTDVCRFADMQAACRTGKVGFKCFDAFGRVSGKMAVYV